MGPKIDVVHGIHPTATINVLKGNVNHGAVMLGFQIGIVECGLENIFNQLLRQFSATPMRQADE